MKAKEKRIGSGVSRGKWGLAGSAAVVLLGILSWQLPWPGDALAHLSYDVYFLLRPDVPTEEAVIVAMDEDSYRALGQDPLNLWNRALHVELLRRLEEGGASVVVFDVLFASGWPDPAVDRELGRAIREHGRVVLAASHQFNDATPLAGKSDLITAVEPIGTNALSGVVEMPLDTDGVVRRHYSDPNYTNLAWATASLLGVAPRERVRERWINFYGQRHAIREVSYAQALEPDLMAADIFKDKVVFVGLGDFTLPVQGGDDFATPYTRWTGFRATGVELQATAFLNLRRGDWMRRLPWGLELLCVLVWGGAVGFGVGGCRPLKALGWGVVLTIGVSGMFLATGWTGHVWFPWLILAGVQMPAAVFWSVLAHGGLARRVAETVPDHALVKRIGKGAYGEVWLARNVIGGYHAVKIIYRDRFDDAKPFEREFRGIQRFMPHSRSLPGWIPILHAGRNDEEGYFYYVMEAGDDRVTGQEINPADYEPKTLGTEIQSRGSLPLRECLALSLELAAAMDQLHRRGLIHRDIKPSNIVFVNGSARFADIGLVTEIRTHGEPVTYLGTRGYIAPEGPGTVQGDIYSLGKVLYQAATGMESHLFPETPTRLMDDAHETGFLELFEIIAKACANETGRRYTTAADLHADLKKLAGQG